MLLNQTEPTDELCCAAFPFCLHSAGSELVRAAAQRERQQARADVAACGRRPVGAQPETSVKEADWSLHVFGLVWFCRMLENYHFDR